MIDLLQSFSIVMQWIFIYFLIRRTNPKRVQTIERVIMPPEDPEPICGCKHHACFHDDSGCNANGDRTYNQNSQAYSYARCGCRGYIGPEVLPKVIAGPS